CVFAPVSDVLFVAKFAGPTPVALLFCSVCPLRILVNVECNLFVPWLRIAMCTNLIVDGLKGAYKSLNFFAADSARPIVAGDMCPFAVQIPGRVSNAVVPPGSRTFDVVVPQVGEYLLVCPTQSGR